MSSKLNKTTKGSKSAVTSDIVVVDESHSACFEIKQLEAQILAMRQQIESKNAMLNTAASAGEQLVNENDDLYQKLNDATKLLKEKEDELESYKRTNDMLEIAATRSADEADELHKKLIESQSITQQLQEENALLTSMKRNASVNRETPMRHSSFDEQSAKDLISTLQHEKQTLEQFLRAEQEKCMKFLQNAEINARKLSHQENENQDLKMKIAQLESENESITINTQHEIQKYSETCHQLQAENESLRNNLQEQEIIVNDLNKDTAHSNIINSGSPTCQLQRQFSMSDAGDDGLFGDLQASGYYDEKFESHPRLLSAEHLDDDTQYSRDNDNISHPSPNQQFRRATVDAQEEFFRLTIIAAKIKYNDVPIATSVLWDKVKQANLSFHELSDWLNDYLLLEREKINEAQKQSQFDRNTQRIITASIKESKDNTPVTPSKHFFRKIKDLADSVTNFSSTLRLEVRFGRRVFEVKMKKHDKLETLLQTLPRIIGEDAESMQILKGNRRLDATQTLSDLHLFNNDVLRMIHQKKVPSYLKRYERKVLMKDDNSSAIEMDSTNTSEII